MKTLRKHYENITKTLLHLLFLVVLFTSCNNDASSPNYTAEDLLNDQNFIEMAKASNDLLSSIERLRANGLEFNEIDKLLTDKIIGMTKLYTDIESKYTNFDLLFEEIKNNYSSELFYALNGVYPKERGKNSKVEELCNTTLENACITGCSISQYSCLTNGGSTEFCYGVALECQEGCGAAFCPEN